MNESNVHVKALEIMNKNGVVDTILIRPLANLLLRQNKNQFRLYDDPDSDNWIDFMMNGEEITIYDDKLVFERSGKVCTAKCDILKLITDF